MICITLMFFVALIIHNPVLTSSIESMILDNWASFRSFRVRDLQQHQNIATEIEIRGKCANTAMGG